MFGFVQKHHLSPLNIHPYTSCTLSSFVHVLFRTYCLPDDYTVPVINDGGLPAIVGRTSKEELKCMYTLQQTEVPDLQYGLGNIQKRFVLPNGHRAFVDGWSEETKTVYEFNGCFVHVSKQLLKNCSSFQP